MELTGGSIEYQSDGINYEKALFTYDEQEKQDNEINRENAKLIFSPKFIPIYPVLLNKLTLTEALLYGFIDFYKSNSSVRFYFTNEQLAKILRCSQDTVSRAISKLETEGFIKTNRRIKEGGGQIRFIEASYEPDSTFSTSQTTKNLQTNNNKLLYTSKKEIYDMLGEDEYMKYKTQIECLWYMIELGHKIEQTKSAIMSEIDWLRERANIYGYRMVDGGYDWNTIKQKFDRWYNFHKEKGDKIERYKSSVLQFLDPNSKMKGKQKR